MRTLLFMLFVLSGTATLVAQDVKPITTDAFLNEPFGFEETITKLTLFSGLKFKVTREPVANIHNPEVVDTVYHLKKGKNTIDVYKGNGKMFVYQAFLKSKKLNMANGIHPGITREVFYSSLKGAKDLGTNVHKIHNSEKTATATVNFKRDRVKSILLEYSVD